MALALDFGTCNTVLARWNAATRSVETLRFDGLSKIYDYRLPGAVEDRRSAVVPSLVHYGEKGKLTAGAQVENAGLIRHRGTFRFAKLNILQGNNRARRINGDLVTPRHAGENLIAQVLLAAGGGGEEMVVTLPVEAFDGYVDWLQDAVLKSFRGTLRMLDEATACILGYQARVKEGEIYLIVDFGGGTLDCSLVKTRDLTGAEQRPCDVLARAGEEIGGRNVDDLLLAEVQREAGLSDEDMEELGTVLLRSIEEAKIRLCSGAERTEITQFDDRTLRLVSHEFTAEALRRLLSAEQPRWQGQSLYRLVARTIERTLETAEERYGTRKRDVHGVFMVGGSSLLLGVAERVRDLFPDCPVHCDDPFEAIARGACRYAGEDLNLSLVHDYCLRAWNRDSKEFELVTVVPKGTRYPTDGPVKKKYLNAACDQATALDLVVIERSSMVRPEDIFVVDPDGKLRRCGARRIEDSALKELNPHDREFIQADPPCEIGERRFVVGFGVDENRRLNLSLKDLKEGNRSFVRRSNGEQVPLPLKDFPLVKL
jgi:molecular chaperone DnaK (HSP70)